MRVRGILVALVLALVAGACTSSKPEVLPPADESGVPPIYVAIGASETTGWGSDQPLRDGWPRVLHRTALPVGSIFVNMGIPGATVAQAMAEEVEATVAARPDLVTVWLNVNDIVRGVSTEEYERQLESLVKAVRWRATTRVLVANTPPLEQLPAYEAGRIIGAVPAPAEVQQVVADYNAAIARVVERQGALLVDVHAVAMAAKAAGTEASFISRDGFHPSTVGHARLGEAFAEVLRRSGPLTVAAR
jgi:lysophospholipase L1-like esterase